MCVTIYSLTVHTNGVYLVQRFWQNMKNFHYVQDVFGLRFQIRPYILLGKTLPIRPWQILSLNTVNRPNV